MINYVLKQRSAAFLMEPYLTCVLLKRKPHFPFLRRFKVADPPMTGVNHPNRPPSTRSRCRPEPLVGLCAPRPRPPRQAHTFDRDRGIGKMGFFPPRTAPVWRSQIGPIGLSDGPYDPTGPYLACARFRRALCPCGPPHSLRPASDARDNLHESRPSSSKSSSNLNHSCPRRAP